MLQQTTTFKKLMRKFLILPHITSRAGNNKVIRPIRSPTTQGDYMVNMVVFAHVLMAVVTQVLLPLKLEKNILLGKSARRTLFISDAIAFRYTTTCPPLFSLSVHSLMGKAFMSIDLIIVFLVSNALFSVLTPVVLRFFNDLLSLCWVTAFMILVLALFTRVVQSRLKPLVSTEEFRSQRFHFCACSTHTKTRRYNRFRLRGMPFQDIFTGDSNTTRSTIPSQFSVLLGKEFRCSGFCLLTVTTITKPRWDGWTWRFLAGITRTLVSSLTGFAAGSQPFSMLRKILKRSGEPLLAFFTAFVYTVHTVWFLSTSISSRPRMFPASRGQTIFFYYTIKALHRQAYAYFPSLN
jgi:hypothetical protein